VFHDRTLAELAARRPSSLGDLGGISGIGAATLERYSKALLKVLASPAKGLPGIDPDGAIHRH
jgi:ATP-dependent DNA helicase RecQ